MVAIDTNVLIRLIVEDDNIQAHKALTLLKKHNEVFISAIVICEVAWVLESCYNLKKLEIIDVFENILRVEQFEIEYSESIWLALNEFKKINADFSDCIVGAIAKTNGHYPVATFDKKAAKSSFFKLIN